MVGLPDDLQPSGEGGERQPQFPVAGLAGGCQLAAGTGEQVFEAQELAAAILAALQVPGIVQQDGGPPGRGPAGRPDQLPEEGTFVRVGEHLVQARIRADHAYLPRRHRSPADRPPE